MNRMSAGSARRIRALVLLVVVSCLVCGLVAGQAVGAPDQSAIPNMALSGPVSGQAAVDALGLNLAAVAEAYGMSKSELTQRLLSDATLTVDRQGRLYYLDVAPAPDDLAPSVEASHPASWVAPASPEDTFLLHSLPGANRVIYLDFNGHTLSGCAWNSYNGGAPIIAPAFDMDGSPGTFSDTERTRIQEIWQRVAEDYAPFAVDVTTELVSEDVLTRSSSADLAYGMRVLISPISSYIGNYGGIAYVDVFDFVGDYYKPALVFPENLGPNSAKYVAEAASHENGHTLALYHDGTTGGVEYYQGQGSGDTGWAPIMGAGYYKNLTQWSKGEYANANNKEDDLAILSTSARIPYRADDHGGSLGGATVLSGTGQLSASGVVGRTGDVDIFAVSSGAGTLTVTASPLAVGSNLDVLLELRDSNGAVVGSSNPVDQLGGSLSAAVAQGTYYVAVSGTGKGDPLVTGYTDYATLGSYTLALTVPAVGGNQAPTAVISANPTSGTAPLAVSFNGNGSSDPDGSIISWAWTFGDGGTATGATTTHTYTAVGTYTATLTVTDNLGATDSETVAISVTSVGNQSPTAVVTATPTSGTAPLTVTFGGRSSRDPDGSIVSYKWTFGDGGTGSGSIVRHIYTAAGTYTATLTVTDNLGATASKSVTITVTAVGNQAPTAVISANPTSGTAPLAVSFNGNGSSDPDGSIISWAWTFGDGGTATGATTTHTYTAAGTYTATLTVTDNLGATASKSVTITVTTSTTKTMYLASKTVTVSKVFGGYQAKAVVKIVDGKGLPVAGASVTGSFGGAVTGKKTGVTGTTGLCTLLSARFPANGTVTFDVTSVTKTGWVYGGILASSPFATVTQAAGPLHSFLWKPGS